MSAQVFDIKQKRHCCHSYQSETRMPAPVGNSLSCIPLIYQYTAVSQPLPVRNTAQSNRPCQANRVFLFSLPFKKTQQIILGPTFPELSRRGSKLLSTALLQHVERLADFHLYNTPGSVHTCFLREYKLALEPQPFPGMEQETRLPCRNNLHMLRPLAAEAACACLARLAHDFRYFEVSQIKNLNREAQRCITQKVSSSSTKPE